MLKTIKMGGNPLENPGIQSDFCWILPDFYRECNFFRDKEVVHITLECDIDHPIVLFRRFSLFHTCIDQKVHHVVYSSHLDSHVA